MVQGERHLFFEEKKDRMMKVEEGVWDYFLK